MNSINNNPFRNSNINMENNNILNNTSPKMKKIDKFEQPIAKNFLNKIKEEIEKAQLICVKRFRIYIKEISRYEANGRRIIKRLQ